MMGGKFLICTLWTQHTCESLGELMTLGGGNTFPGLPRTYKAGCIQALMPLLWRGFIPTAEYDSMHVGDTLSASVTVSGSSHSRIKSPGFHK